MKVAHASAGLKFSGTSSVPTSTFLTIFVRPLITMPIGSKLIFTFVHFK